MISSLSITQFRAAVVCLVFLAVAPLHAGQLLPPFSDIPTGWFTDRYAPASFSNVGSYQGQSNVLGIGIDASGSFNNRPAPYQSTFYNTQGDQHAITGGVGDLITAALFIPSSWADPSASGNVRTDMWGVMTDGTTITNYPVIGFTNYGGAPRYRVWDDSGSGQWIDLALPVQYDQWTGMGIALTPTSIVYTINGSPVAGLTDIGSTTNFSATIFQAYNFGGDPSITGATFQPYTAYWAEGTPEPGTVGMVLGGVSLVILGRFRGRRK